MRGKVLTRMICAGVMVLFATLVITTNSVRAQSRETSLEGVWEVMTTPRDCATGEPNPVSAFVAQYTFHADGKMISWYSSGTPSTGQGLWQRQHGWSDHSFRLVRILRTTTGTFGGKQEIGGTVTLSQTGDQYTSDEYMIVYGMDGTPGPRRCINSVATRFKLE